MLAANQGHTKAQFNLGVMYDAGEGVKQDFRKAAKWYRLAAKKGFAQAQFNLGIMYREGEGVLQDNLRAHMWWNIAASRGHESAKRKRTSISREMSLEAVERAQFMARKCVESGYEVCN